METYADNGLAQYYAGTMDKKSKPKKNIGKCKNKKKKVKFTSIAMRG